MKNILNKILNFNILNNKSDGFDSLKKIPEVKKIFNIFNLNSINREIRFVGGCVRKILSKEKVDDIDLAINVEPSEVKKILDENGIKYIEVGIEHGTVIAQLNKQKFEITSLRRDVDTDGRHAKVEFTKNWYEDASRRDFSINSIYSDIDGNLFDPHDGKKNLKRGKIEFIGSADKRIKEDYLRILRYLRFFINYSKLDHDIKIKKIIRQNLVGIKQISKERLLDELKKIFKSKKFLGICEDLFSVEILSLIFPELKNLKRFNNLNDYAIDLLNSKDFVFLLSLAIVDETDNSEYFLFKYNISNDDKKRVSLIKKYYHLFTDRKFFLEKNLSKLHYIHGNGFIIELIDFKIFTSKKFNKNLINIKKLLSTKLKPTLPVNTKILMKEYNLKEGRELGFKLKKIENIWIENGFQISEDQIKKICLN